MILRTRNKISVLLFALGVVGFYFLFVEIYMPDVRPAPPPKDEVFDISLISEEEFASFGERIFTGKGSCRLCHQSVGGRAPALVDVAFTAEGRIKEAGYKGRARTRTGYILESMLEPSAYVVKGYGKIKGGINVSPMPAARSAPVNLSPLEIRAVAAYLLQGSGVEVSIKPSLEMPTYGVGALE